MVGRVTASAMASASRLSFLCDLTYGLTHGGAMSFTSWPDARKRLAQSCAPPQASRPMSTIGSFARKGSRSCRDKRLRNTIFPVLSIPTACNTCFARSIPRTVISCFMGLTSCGSMGSLIFLNSLWLIAVDPHRGGSISLRPTPIFSSYAGRVTRVMAKPGNVVQPTSPLLDLYTPDLMQAQADLIGNATATLAKAKNALSLARRTEERQHQLYLEKAAALKDWQQAQADVQNAESDVRAAEAALLAARDKLRAFGKSEADIARIEQGRTDRV